MAIRLLRKTRSHGKHGACLKNCVAGETRLKLMVRIGQWKGDELVPEDLEIGGIYQEHNDKYVLLKIPELEEGNQLSGWPQVSIQNIEVVA